MKDIKIIVATHKPYRMPEDEMYIPLQVGALGGESFGIARDDTGENISAKNPYFCELTGLYWGWKNLSADYIGLVHYKRYFTLYKNKKGFEYILSGKQAQELIKKSDIIFPKKRNYYIENLYSHYEHTLYAEQLDKTREILAENHPDFLSEFDRLKKRRSAHMFNMMIMKKSLLDEYCEWLFNILFELEKRIKDDSYNSFHKRYPGRVSELLLDVFINTKGYNYCETYFMNTENRNRLKKAISFLEAKFFGKKYRESF